MLLISLRVFYSGAYEWAQKTLKDHAKDKRPYVYTREQLEKAKTHDKLWNGAQVGAGPLFLSDVKRWSFVSYCCLLHVSISTRW